jgi:hypothetical protein
MDSSPEDRLAVILEIYETARDQLDSDMAQATTDEQADAIQENVDRLKRDYMKAERERLDSRGAEVESAYRSAKSAAENVIRAYRQGKALAERIRTVSAAVTAVSSLVRKGVALA